MLAEYFGADILAAIMNLAREELRLQNYNDLGVVLARTAAGIGAPITTETEDRWAGTVASLAGADDISETTPELLEDPAALLDVLDVESRNPHLVTAAANLLAASKGSRTATTLTGHFVSRAREAVGCTDLLRFQSPNNIRDNDGLWGQLGGLTILGTYFDSFIDCREDAADLPQFSAGQLARGSLVNMARTLRAVRPETIISCAKACHDTGMQGHIAIRLAKPLLGSSY